MARSKKTPIASHQPDDDLPQEMDRRSWPRYPSGVTGDCGPLGDGLRPLWSAEIRDVSQGGLSLLALRPFQPGTILVVHVEGEDAETFSRFVVRVVHARPHRRRGWLVGCSFARPVSEAEIDALRSGALMLSCPNPSRLGGDLD
jgi:hypothetical protein